jgi:hypothetical protein
MTHLAGRAVGAADELAVADDPATDARTDHDRHRARGPPRRARARFGQGRAVRVVVHPDVHLELLLEQVGEGVAPKPDVARERHRTPIGRQRAGHGDSGGQANGRELPHQRAQSGDEPVARHRRLLQARAHHALVDDRRARRGPADVEGDARPGCHASIAATARSASSSERTIGQAARARTRSSWSPPRSASTARAS